MGWSRKATHFVLVVGLILVRAPSYGSDPAPPGTCEFDAQVPVTAAVNLLMDGHQSGLVSEEQLQKMIDSDPHTWTNPFAPHARTLKGQSSFKGFGRVIKFLKGPLADAVREKLQSALNLRRQEQEQTHVAQEKSKLIFGNPQLVETLQIPNSQSGEFGEAQSFMASGEFDGRPIFAGVYRHHTHRDRYVQVLFDPFHADPQERARIIRDGKDLRLGQTLLIFQRKGSPYLLSMGDNYAYDIKNKSEVSPQDLGIPEMERPERSNLLHTRTENGEKLVISEP